LESCSPLETGAMGTLVLVVIVVVVLGVLYLALALKIVKQYERGVLFRLGRVIGTREPGLVVTADGVLAGAISPERSAR